VTPPGPILPKKGSAKPNKLLVEVSFAVVVFISEKLGDFFWDIPCQGGKQLFATGASKKAPQRDIFVNFVTPSFLGGKKKKKKRK